MTLVILAMTIETIRQFLEQWWFLIAALGGAFWACIKLYYKIDKKMDIMQGKINSLQAQLNEHDAADKLMETRLSGLIDRNKEATEASTRQVQDKLEHIGNTLVKLSTQTELILQNRIKTP